MSGPPHPHAIYPEVLRDTFSKAVTVAIVLTTLASAVVGFLDSQASSRAHEAGVKAQELAAKTLGDYLRAQQDAYARYEMYALAQEHRARLANMRQWRYLRSVAPELGAERPVLTSEENRLDAQAERLEELAGVAKVNARGVKARAGFSDRLFAENIRVRERLRALQDHANEEHLIWKQRVHTYSAVVTMFAVAVYLFGMSLNIPRPGAKVLTGLGIILVLAGSVWGVVTVLGPPHPSDEQIAMKAADAYAAGMETVYLADGPEDYRQATEHFTAATRLRPTFARAFVELANAVFRAGSPQAGESYVSLADARALDESTKHLREAMRLGDKSRALLGELGFNMFLHALTDPFQQRQRLHESIEYTRRAIRLDPTNAVLHYNLGVALLAAGQKDNAFKAYIDAVNHTLYLDVAKKERRSRNAQRPVVAGALTDLSILLGRRRGGQTADSRDLEQQVLEMKEYIIGSISGGKPGTKERRARVPRIKATVFPAEVDWVAYDSDLQPGDVVYAVWYYHSEREGLWSVIPGVSDIVAPVRRENAGYGKLVKYLPTALRCLRPGRYAVELYVNGHLNATTVAVTNFREMTATVMRDLNVAMCRPLEWKRIPRPIPGIVDGYVDDGGTRGVYFYRFHHPRAAADLPQVSEEYLDRVLASAFSPKPTFHEGARTTYFLELQGIRKGWYRYHRGAIYAGAGIHPVDGAVVVGLVFGPSEYFSGAAAEPYRMFESFIEYESYRR